MPAESCAFTILYLFSIYTSLKYSLIFLFRNIFERIWGYLIAITELYRITVILV